MSGKYHVRFGRSVNFSYIYFSGKNVLPSKLTELLTLMTVVDLGQVRLVLIGALGTPSQ